jgi:DNA polymerase-3 subunit epsilon
VLKIQVEVFAVTYEETGSELGPFLKESEEILRKSLIHRAQRKSVFIGSISENG